MCFIEIVNCSPTCFTSDLQLPEGIVDYKAGLNFILWSQKPGWVNMLVKYSKSF